MPIGSGKLLVTSYDRGVTLLISIKRVRPQDIDDKTVFYAAGGPYQGVFVSKPGAVYSSPSIPAQGEIVLEAQVEDQRVQDISGDRKKYVFTEYRSLRVWFESSMTEETIQKAYMQSLVKDLIEPHTFPKDYGNFIKKLISLAQHYNRVTQLDLELSYPDDDTTTGMTVSTTGTVDDGIDQTLVGRRFITIDTPAEYNHHYIRELATQGKNFISFRVKAACDAHVALSEFFGDPDCKTHEIVLGADGNNASYIRDTNTGTNYGVEATPGILSSDEYRPFWISWTDKKLEVGKGHEYGKDNLMKCIIDNEFSHSVNNIGVSTSHMSTGTWEFIELAEVAPASDIIAPDQAQQMMKASKNVSLVLMAQKQRMVDSLEHAYPNALTTEDLMRAHRVKASDKGAIMVLLSELAEQGVIKEVEHGRWIRNLGLERTDQHELIEGDIYQMTMKMKADQQPVVGIITTLFCEKLAMDAMMEDKITYVKYKIDGESTVYTLGRIGNIRVVCTKLSRVGGERAATISAGNTTTRLLGTFNKIEHVVLIGVGGGVPNYEDTRLHVRRADVVVSYPCDDSGDLYFQIDKIQKTESRSHSFITKTWKPGDATLLKVVHSMMLASDGRRMWEQYLAEGKRALELGSQTAFYRPAARLDKLYRPEGDSLVEVEPPMSDDPPERVRIRYGHVSSGRHLMKTPLRALEFAVSNHIRSYDLGFSAVMESLDGNRLNSFLFVRGIADYADGSRGLEWQPYSALAAAAYTKAVVSQLSAPDKSESTF